MKRTRVIAALITTLVALTAMSTSAAGAERGCGTVTAVQLSDPATASVSIEGRKYIVGGSSRNVHLPPASELRVGVAACAQGDFRPLADGSVDLTNGSVGLLREGARGGDAVAICGRMHGLDAPTATNNEGLVSLADEIWFLSGTPGPNNLSPQATVGSNVCLNGTVATSQTTRNLVIRWSLVPGAAQSPAPTTPSPAPTTAPPPTSAPVATAAASAQVSALPATAPQPINSTPLILGAAVALVALAGLLIARVSAGRRRSS